MTDWTHVPKVELHLHLEGAAPPEFIRELAAERRVDLARLFDDAGNYAWSDFAEFLNAYERACEVLTTPGDYHRLMDAVLRKSAEDGVKYTEIFLAPDLCGDGSSVAWAEYLAAMTEAAREVEGRYGIVARFIPTAVRHLGAETAERTAETTASNMNEYVTGFGMGGEERFGHPKDFARAFALAGEAGLGLTAHAGEICGADSVADALEHLKVTRIGHGVRAIEDAAIVEMLRERGTVLEVNPGSNIALGVYRDWNEHPFKRLRDAGVPVTVSTDDPPYFHTDLPMEYDRLSRCFGWNKRDFLEMNRVAMGAAFCDEETRSKIYDILENGDA